MNYLPKHNCRNCGACCGPVPINEDERKNIQNYIDTHHIKANNIVSNLTCKFRVANKCSIYPVRPMICRLMGVTQGMECQYGNTYEIDGSQYIKKKSLPIGLLNDLIK